MNTQSIHNREQRMSAEYPSDTPNEIIENQTQKIPNLIFLGLAAVSIVTSLTLALRSGKKTDLANFVGEWAPTFLILGLYNKLVKVETELLSEPGQLGMLH